MKVAGDPNLKGNSRRILHSASSPAPIFSIFSYPRSSMSLLLKDLYKSVLVLTVLMRLRHEVEVDKDYLFARKFCRIFSLPSNVIFVPINVDISAGIMSLYLLKFSDNNSRLPITYQSQSRICPSSSGRPLYFVIFSCSFCESLMSLGHETSIV